MYYNFNLDEMGSDGKIKNGSPSRKGSQADSSSSDSERKRKKLLGVEMAPINIPWERRMETLAVASWICTFIFAGPTGLLFMLYLAIYTRFYWVALLYLVWWVYDKDIVNKGGRRSEWVRKWKVWRRYCNFFPIKLVKTVDLDPTKNYLFGSHPHGVLCSGAFGSFATEALGFSRKFPQIRPYLLTLEGHLSFPLYREYLMCSGTSSASKSSLNYLLSYPGGGNAAVLVPGGAPESLEAHPGLECRVHLKKRKGFIKVALQNGAALVPVFSFGETDIYDQIPNEEGSRVRKIQNKLQQVIGMAPVIVLGRGLFQYTFGILPQRRPITVVVGGPIPCEKSASPTQKQIDDLHDRYVEGLTNLFNKYKADYANKDSVLKIV